MSQERLLRTAFLAGALTDALALVPLLSPFFASLLWGWHDTSPVGTFANGYAASLMLGWTVLLLWAARRPVERRFVAPLTIIVIDGLVATEILAVARGSMPVVRMAPTWLLQAALLVLFAAAYHRPRILFGSAAAR
jgi:hypothetical protein